MGGTTRDSDFSTRLIAWHRKTELSAASVGIATSALRFLYKVTLKRDWALEDIPMPKKPFRLPVILSRDEVARLLEAVSNLEHRTILTAT